MNLRTVEPPARINSQPKDALLWRELTLTTLGKAKHAPIVVFVFGGRHTNAIPIGHKIAKGGEGATHRDAGQIEVVGVRVVFHGHDPIKDRSTSACRSFGSVSIVRLFRILIQPRDSKTISQSPATSSSTVGSADTISRATFQ